MTQIKSLEEMEQIVSRNKTLSWDGWTVVASFQSDKGRTSKSGALIKGKWYIQKRYVPTRNGWEIPDNVIKGNNEKPRRLER